MIVPFPSQIDIVVVEKSAKLAVAAVAMASKHLSTLSSALGCEPAGLRLEDRGNGMKFFNDWMSRIQDILVVFVPFIDICH